MLTDLGLKGNELIAYAIIYGFSQVADHRFHGSLNYLAEWMGVSKKTAERSLKSLVEQGLLTKYDREINGVRFCDYAAVVPETVVKKGKCICPTHSQNDDGGMDNLTHHNIDNSYIYTPCVSNTGYKPNTDTLPNNTTNPIEKPVLDTRPPKGESGGGRSPIPYEAVKSEYNAICKSLPECKALTEKRKREIKARFAEGFTLDTFSELFRKAEASSFCKGGGKTGWVANFDFLVGTRAIKVLEGAYDNDPATNAPSCVRHELTDEEFDALFPLPGENEGE